MENNTKKVVIPLIAGSCSLVTIGATTLVALNLINKNRKINPSPEVKPLNRDYNYEHYVLTQYFRNDETFNKIINSKFENDQYVKWIDENKFKQTLGTEIRKILQSIPKFSQAWDQYEITINYQMQNSSKNVVFDIVWNLPNSDKYYYDQINMSL